MDYAAAYKGNFINSVCLLADELKKRDVHTVMVFPQRAVGREWLKELSQSGYETVFLPDSFKGAVKVLKKLFKEKDILCVHTHFLDKKTYLPLRAVKLFKKFPHYFHAHSMPRQSKRNYKTYIRRCLLSAEKILCVSDSVAEKYSSLGFGNCVTVRNSICFQRLDEYEIIDRKELCGCGKHSVLMFGYDFKIKGIDTAVEAFEKFDKNHNLTLCICVASQIEKAKEFITNRFGEIPSWIKLLPPRPDVASYMKAADVFLSASRTEGFSYAAAEAAYCGARVVLSDIAAHRELQIPDAVLFETGNEKALYDAVIKILDSEKTDKNKEYVAKTFSIGKWIEKLCGILIS